MSSRGTQMLREEGCWMVAHGRSGGVSEGMLRASQRYQLVKPRPSVGTGQFPGRGTNFTPTVRRPLSAQGNPHLGDGRT